MIILIAKVPAQKNWLNIFAVAHEAKRAYVPEAGSQDI